MSLTVGQMNGRLYDTQINNTHTTPTTTHTELYIGNIFAIKSLI